MVITKQIIHNGYHVYTVSLNSITGLGLGSLYQLFICVLTWIIYLINHVNGKYWSGTIAKLQMERWNKIPSLIWDSSWYSSEVTTSKCVYHQIYCDHFSVIQTSPTRKLWKHITKPNSPDLNWPLLSYIKGFFVCSQSLTLSMKPDSYPRVSTCHQGPALFCLGCYSIEDRPYRPYTNQSGWNRLESHP